MASDTPMVANAPNMITSAALRDIPSIAHAFFTRENGVSAGLYEGRNIGLGSDDDRRAVLENRTRCARELGVSLGALTTPHQIHSAKVVTVETPWPQGEGPKADALVTAKRGILLGVATADCGPVLFADNKAGVIGTAHSGWKGAMHGIIDATVEAMEALGASRENISACLGPTISQRAYEVGPEFFAGFIEQSIDNRHYFKPSDRPQHMQFDLPRFIIDKLRQLKLADVNNLALCTYADEKRFYSYRRTTHRKEPDYGRLLSAIIQH